MRRFFPTAALVLLLAGTLLGCGPSLHPLNASMDRSTVPALPGDFQAGPGQSLVSVYLRYVFPAYEPKVSRELPEVRGIDPQALRPGQRWVAYDATGPDELVLRRSGVRDGKVGILVDRAGVVIGRRPLLDMHRRVRPTQEEWGVGSRDVFSPAEPEAVDRFVFDAVFEGEEEGAAVLLVRDAKIGAVAPGEHERVLVRPGQSLERGGVRITVLSAGPEKVVFSARDVSGD